MEKRSIASYGNWKSSITAEKIADGVARYLNVIVDPTSNTTYWVELRPSNDGKYTLVKCEERGTPQDLTSPEFNVRSGVYEYGGAPFTVHKGTVFFTNYDDHKAYRIDPGDQPKPLTQGETERFADFHYTPYGLLAVGEKHHPNQEPENFLALINHEYRKIAQGYDFYASPCISPDQKKIAYICWNHPHMPWTNTELWTADFTPEGNLTNHTQIAGHLPESIFQPQFDPTGTLYFISDREEWWNLYRVSNGTTEKIFNIEGEIGVPLWRLQRSRWTFLGDDILFTYNKDGFWTLALFQTATQTIKPFERKGCEFAQLRPGKNCAILMERYTNKAPAFIRIDNQTHEITTLYDTEKDPLDPEMISQPQHISFPSQQRTAYGLLYLPNNKHFQAPENELPPLLINVHGGPTSQAKAAFSLKTQFWTTRGYAVLEVNYGGSSGYGRSYRELLNKQWGIIDCEDCCQGALYLVKEGIVDGNRLAIRGGSAGGYTTLATLAFHDVFKAGASHYGICDLLALKNETHKFESRYLDYLVGDQETLIQRSPIHAANRINAPLILFQGENDRVVPPNQSKKIYEAIKQNGVKTELHIYPAEHHGFRQAKHITHVLKCEEAFYQEVFKT